MKKYWQKRCFVYAAELVSVDVDEIVEKEPTWNIRFPDETDSVLRGIYPEGFIISFGQHTPKAGDYVIFSGDDIYLCPKDVFEFKYEPETDTSNPALKLGFEVEKEKVCIRCGAKGDQLKDNDAGHSCLACGTSHVLEVEDVDTKKQIEHLGVVGAVCHSILQLGEDAMAELIEQKLGIKNVPVSKIIDAIWNLFPHTVDHDNT